ncbi:MAG: hypothetical protein ACLFP2_00005 [Candidatus Woesearchaeota archaeon]
MSSIEIARMWKKEYEENRADAVSAVMMVGSNYAYNNIANNQSPYSLDELTSLIGEGREHYPDKGESLQFAVHYAIAYDSMAQALAHTTDDTALFFANGCCEQLEKVTNAMLEIQQKGNIETMISISGKASAFIQREPSETAKEFAELTKSYGSLCESYLEFF